MRTPSSSSCQFGLGVVLRYLSLSLYTRTQFPYQHCLSQSLATFTLLSSLVPEWHNLGPLWHSQALGLRELCSQLGTAGRGMVPSLGITTKTWPYNWVGWIITCTPFIL